MPKVTRELKAEYSFYKYLLYQAGADTESMMMNKRSPWTFG